MATLQVPDPVPSVEEDSEQLRNAFQGWGTNEGQIISILAHRNAHQRRSIRDTYKATYDEDLLKAIDKELNSDFEKAVHLWTLDPYERDAYLANEAIKNRDSSNWVIMEIACTRSSENLFQVRRAYHDYFKKSIEEEVAQHTTGDFRKLLVALVTAYRYEGSEVSMSLAKSEAKILHDKIQEKLYGDDEVVRILSTRSKPQLSAVMSQYNNDYGNSINKDLRADMNDEFLCLIRATTKSLTTPEKYFEKQLRKAINKLGTDEGALTRVITTRAEVDLARIKQEYYRKNSVTLHRAIAKDTHGDYEDMLLALVGEDQE